MEIAEGMPVIYGGSSFGGGPPIDSETGLPQYWSGDLLPDASRIEFNAAHNRYIRMHLKEIKRATSQPAGGVFSAGAPCDEPSELS